MTSKADTTEAFVWNWLPGATEPVVAGRFDQDGDRLLFTYGASYRRRKSAISLYSHSLPPGLRSSPAEASRDETPRHLKGPAWPGALPPRYPAV